MIFSNLFEVYWLGIIIVYVTDILRCRMNEAVIEWIQLEHNDVAKICWLD